jgi:gliding motility-associated-like protein
LNSILLPDMKLIKSKYNFLILLLQVSIIPTYGIATANFSYTKLSNCAPTIITFTNSSTIGTAVTYTWDFGQGSVNSTTDYSAQEQVYSKAGQYKVTLTVYDGSTKTTDIKSTVITIYEGPTSNFTADKVNGCPPLLVNYTSTSTPGASGITTTLWDFRTGDSKEGTPVQYTYTSVGIYDLILKVTDKNGCSSTFESDKLITVADKPNVNFAASDTFACSPPLNVSFINLSTGSSELTCYWDFGNGSTSTDLSNSSVYSSIGSYNVKLKATDQFGCSDSLIKKSYITIGYKKGTLAVYNANNNIVTKSYLCDGTYKFVYSSATLPDYTWKITDNGTSTTISGNDTLTYKVTGSGVLSIKLVYGKNSYCTDSITASFTKTYLKAGFSINDTLFCSVPSRVTLTNSSENADNFSWFLSNKLISNVKSTSYTITQSDLPTETYQQLYNHEINTIRLPFKLVAYNSGACYDSITSYVAISLPVARFMPDKVSGCVPLTITLSDSSKSSFNIDTYTYKIGSDSITTSKSSSVSYTVKNPGVYYVTETIRSGSCNDISEVIKIVAGDKLVPDFTVTPAEVCNGGNIHLKGNVSDNSLVNMWRFKSSNLFDLSFNSRPDTTITIYSDTSGYKNITLQVDYNGCISATTQKSILKIKGPTGSFSESFSCDSSLIYHFKSNISPVTSLIWNIDTSVINNVNSPRYVFPARGDYTVKLTATDNSSGCTLIKTKILKVRNVLADFTLSDTILCAGDSLQLNASSSKDYINSCFNEGFLWNFGDDSPPARTFSRTYFHVYTSKGTDTIKLIVTADNGCTDTTKKLVMIYRPSGSFTTDKTSGCVPEMNINFKNTSTDNTIVNWIWNFGDQSSDSTKSISIAHNYSSSTKKTYYPSLTVYDAHQCYSNYSIPIQIIGINNDFQADDKAICIGGTVTFTPVDSTLTKLYWDFGDGTNSTTTNTHTYTTSGSFNVSLAATKESCRDTLTKSKYISVEKANANFTMSDSVFYCYPDTVNFVHNNSVDSPAAQYLWTFDSNVLSDKSSNNVNYTYTKPGNHTALLKVTTLNGCTATNSKNIKISGPTAVVTFTPDKICYNDEVTFKIDSLTNVDSWKLLFGDGSTATDNPSSHRYTSRGKIVPSIQLISGTCHAISYLDTLYAANVKANFRSSDSSLIVCYGNKLNLLNTSLYSTSWNWAIDSVQKSTSYNFGNILFDKTGKYNIRLIASDTSGCSDTLTKTFTVAAIPVFTISGDSILCSGTKSITLSVTQSTGDGIRWAPTSGVSNAASFTTLVTPTSTTTYTATVTNIYGCSSSQTKTILVNQPSDFTRSPLGDTTIYLGEKVQLIVLTTVSNFSYSWSPHDNISCNNCNNPWVSPIKTTTYTVEMTDKCFDFSEKFLVNVIADFYLEAPGAFTPNGDSNNDLFKFEEKNIKNFDLKIFNRWGEIVFSTNDVNNGWDGTVNSHAQNIDTYVYKVKAETIHGYSFEKRGEFLLLK